MPIEQQTAVIRPDNNRTILYVEDNRDNLQLVKRVLQAAGFTVLGAADGLSGIDLACAHLPALILMDIHLPGIDGYVTTQKIRQIEKLAHIPIIALTANVTAEDRQQSREAGCVGFIQKPINVDTLPAQIHAYLSGQAKHEGAL